MKFPLRLMLTTPYRRGKWVKAAQHRLNGANRLRKDFLKSPVDGEWGPLSQQAARNAQYWLGFPPKAINGVYGPVLHQYLLPIDAPDAKRLPVMFRARRRARLRLAALQARKERKRIRMVKLAISQIGTVESPAGSNNVKYSRWYGMRGPWCAMFVSWCAVHVGLDFKYAYCPYVEADAAAGRNGLSLVGQSRARLGDVALFHFGSGEAKHIGIVESVNLSAGTVTCIEGNTSEGDGGSQDNGGGVFRRTRPLSHVRRFVRIKVT